jgi:fructokinase
MSATILAFGEILWDLLPSGDVLGGAPFNFAYRVNSLGDRAIIVSRLGQDDRGHRAWAQIQQLGLERSCIQRDASRPTGTVPVRLDEEGNPDFTIIPGVAYDCIQLTEELLARVPSVDCFCFGTLVQRSQASRRTLHELLAASPDSLKVLDINLRKDCYTPDTVRGSLERADILKLNEDELRYLGELAELGADALPELCGRVLERWQLTVCLVTLGGRGAFAATKRGEQVYVPGYRVNVQDTCGSGDAFTAAFIHHYLSRRPLAECVQAGNALGALVASKPGATTPVGEDEVQALLAGSQDLLIESSLRAFLAG